MAHQEIGMRQIERIRTDLQDLATVEQMPKMEGRQMVMAIALWFLMPKAILSVAICLA